MRRTYVLPLILSVFLFSACAEKKKEEQNGEITESETMTEENPFATKSNLPYQAPDFNKIKDEHFKPAIEGGIESKRKEIEEIANNPEEATFDNTLVALEKSGEDLTRVLRV